MTRHSRELRLHTPAIAPQEMLHSKLIIGSYCWLSASMVVRDRIELSLRNYQFRILPLDDRTILYWRRREDSNLRAAYATTYFLDRRLNPSRPLLHNKTLFNKDRL